MKKLKAISVFVLLAAFPFFVAATADGAQEKPQADKSSVQQKAKEASSSAAKPATVKMLQYKPPLRGAPAGRVGGGTRGVDRESFQLMVLAPDHIGNTVQDQPSLYWYISKVTTYPVELTVIERNTVKPLLEKVIKSPEKSGIQVVRLSDYGISLKRNIQYKWFVTLVTDSAYRSKDILAGGIITSIDAAPSLQERLKEAGAEAPFVYAEEGLWYDAFDSLSAGVEADPDNQELRKQRAVLLEQVGLKEVADSEVSRELVSQ